MHCHKLSQNEGLYIIYHRPSQVIESGWSSLVGNIFIYLAPNCDSGVTSGHIRLEADFRDFPVR
jgi:hypothetical protein